MQSMKLNVAFATFPYGGCGAVPSEHPSIRHWMLDTLLPLRDDERIGDIKFFDISDTPITMSRNQAVVKAREIGADVLVMIDSDNWPDYHLGERTGSKPFFSSSFDFLYEHYRKGPVVVGAPYCGPAPNRLAYVFKWCFPSNDPDDVVDLSLSLTQMTREEADMMGGIQEVGALPTGCIMYDMRIFSFEDDDGGIVEPPWFFYEWEGELRQCESCGERYSHNHSFDNKPVKGFRHMKTSTEDVAATRDMSFHGLVKLKYNPVFCNFDAWAGHMKVECVGAPQMYRADNASRKFQRAVNRIRHDEQMVILGNGQD